MAVQEPFFQLSPVQLPLLTGREVALTLLDKRGTELEFIMVVSSFHWCGGCSQFKWNRPAWMSKMPCSSCKGSMEKLDTYSRLIEVLRQVVGVESGVQPSLADQLGSSPGYRRLKS